MARYRLITWPKSQETIEQQNCFEVETPDGPGAFVQDPEGDHVLLDWPEAQKYQYLEGTYEIYDTDKDGDIGDYLGTMVPLSFVD